MITRFINWLGIVALAAVLVTCGSLQPTPEELSDPSKTLQVVVRSNPPGAKVFGIVADTAGTFCGTTPFTARYIMRKTATGPQVFGTVPQETITDKGLDFRSPFRFSHAFQCILILEGYEPHRVFKILDEGGQFNPYSFNTSDAFAPGRQVVVSVDLIPISSK